MKRAKNHREKFSISQMVRELRLTWNVALTIIDEMGGKRKNIEIRSKSSKKNIYVGEKFDIPEGVFPSD